MAVIFTVTPFVAFAATQTVNRPVTVTATVLGPPPTTPAVITAPSGNITVGVTPLVVSGTCGPGLEVRLTNNGILVGTTTCALDGTFTINISLNEGINNLAVLNFDTLNQAGPASATITVTVRSPQVTTPTQPGQGSSRPTTAEPLTTPSSGEDIPQTKPSIFYHGDNPIIQSFTRPDSIATLVTLGGLLTIGFLFLRKRKHKS